ncbi:MAG: hypothetical protein IPL58_01670 [Betaproteobacteria bacterium]|uniref:Proteinase inhibitor I42 chagasin domain-containing protein n=1 Tax=Candidatus Proximibacter danicus TaxID=2954365 RepID=A0A9D7JY63_9PROT|nr:hypothetical protein [Candidatus Proximibacter danicus]
MIYRVLAAIFLLTGATLAIAADFEIVGAEFGIFEEGKGNEILFQPSNYVPLAVGQRYGWIIEVRTLKRTLAVREEYVLPKAPGAREPDSAVAKNLHIPDLRRSQVSQRQLVPMDGQIVGEWSIGPGEPPGKRRLQVTVEGQVAATFDFEVK